MARCPYNDVMSFIYRYKPSNKIHNEINLLEVGCGDGNNIWFAAKEGFNVNGIDIDENRIEYAKTRLEEDNLKCNLKIGNFITLPFNNESMDLVFDRGAITCCSLDDVKKTINEIHRVLKSGGKFYFNPYSENDENIFKGEFMEDGRVGNFKQDSNLGNTSYAIYYYSLKEIVSLFKDGWKLIEINQVNRIELLKKHSYNSSVWEVIVEKID